MLLSLAACGKGGENAETGGAVTTAPPTETPPADTEGDGTGENPVFEPTVLDLVKGGETKFTIIYSHDATGSEIDIALKLKESFEKYTGASISTNSDFTLDPSADTSGSFEILVGNTNRKETSDVLALVEGSKDYAVAVSGNKLVIAGKSVSATLNASYYFVNQYLAKLDMEKGGDLSYSSEQNYFYKAVYPVENFGILGNKATEYKIVIPANASYGEERFALRVKYIIAVRTGYSLDIVRDSEPAADKEILVGKTARTTASVADNEYAIVAKGSRIELLGGGLYDYEYFYNYCANKLCAHLRDSKADAGDIYRASTVENLKADAIETVIDKKGELRFMLFNILGEDRPEHPLKLGTQMVYAMVEELQPDILFINEYSEDAQMSYNYPLHDRLPALGYGIADGNLTLTGREIVGTPIFYKSDVFELVYEDSFMPDGHESNMEHITSCVLKRKSDGKLLALVNCHLAYKQDEETEAMRADQIKFAIDKANALQAEYSCDVMLAGDMNCKVTGSAYTILKQRKFENVRDLATVRDDTTTYWGTDPTYNVDAGVLERSTQTGTTYEAGAIDHTFYLGNGLTIKRFDILTDPCSLSVSDHASTVTDFDLGTYTSVTVEPYVGDWTKNY